VDSQVVLVAVNLTVEKLAAIENEVDTQAHALSRVDIVRQSVAKSIIVKVSSLEDAVLFSNDYAPEHLILHLENAGETVSSINNAGSIFVGPYSPERCDLRSQQVFTALLIVFFFHQLRRLCFRNKPHPSDQRIRKTVQRSQHTIVPEAHYVSRNIPRWSQGPWTCCCHPG